VARGNLTITVTPDRRNLPPATFEIEVEDVEQVMKELHRSTPGIQVLDLLLRVVRRI